MNIFFCYRQLHEGDEVVFACVPSSLSGMESVVTDHGVELFQLPDSGLLQDVDTAHVCSYMHKLYCRPIATGPLICVCFITAAILDCFGSHLSNFHNALSDKGWASTSCILELANATLQRYHSITANTIPSIDWNCALMATLLIVHLVLILHMLTVVSYYSSTRMPSTALLVGFLTTKSWLFIPFGRSLYLTNLYF